ncbi:MAG TPA: hypothetical protein VFT00_02985 [Nocardioides sp.]|nr:hypothetical protein [Nocardioides sp.]
MVLGQLDSLDAAATLARAESVLHQRRAAEVEDLRLIAHWAALHSFDPRRESGRRVWCGEDRLVDVGGDGTPRVQELCVHELAVVRQVHPLSCRNAMADVLDLQHRLPRCWDLVESLQVDAWVARKVAAMTRHLEREAAFLVDRAVADALATESPSRVFTITTAKIIEADPATHEAKVEEERRRRYVALSRTDGQGLRHVIARVTAGDAVWVDAIVDRVADILVDRHPEGTTKDELRSIAFGWLARPAELLQLLLEAADPATVDQELAGALRDTDLTKLRPIATLYVHLSEAAVSGETSGVARCEQLGPLLVRQVADLLGHANVSLQPVIDLRDAVSTNAYEHPESLKERVWLTTAGDYFPYATGTSRDVDYDHPDPYVAGGRRGQTGTHNSGPLGRTNHRAKTHLGYRCRQTGPGEYVWRTPHGHHRLVDNLGTHYLPANVGEGFLSDDPLDRTLSRMLVDLRAGRLDA